MIIPLLIFNASPQQFQSNCFIEGLAIRVLIIFTIGTWVTPIYRSKPSRLLTFSSVAIVVLASSCPTPRSGFCSN